MKPRTYSCTALSKLGKPPAGTSTPERRQNNTALMLLVAFLSVLGALSLSAQTPSPVQQCGSHNIRGFPVTGLACGGTTRALGCSSGALYNCSNTTNPNNCTLVQACAIGCLQADSTQGNVTSSCYSGAKPVTVTQAGPLGGDDLSVTVQESSPHPGGVILNMRVDRGDLVPGMSCAATDLVAGQNTETFGLSTKVVGTPTPVQISSDFNWNDPSGVGFELASVPQLVTLGPGGQEPPPPPLQSISMTPASIGPNGISFMNVALTRMAPASGVTVNVASSDPATAAILANGQPFVMGSCFTNNLTETVQAASSVPATKTISLSASSGAAGQAALTTPLTVTGGCVPHGCTGGPSCGPQPDGCGGTIANCGCFNVPGQVCGANNLCTGPPAFAVSGLTLSPSSITGGSTSTATVTANQPAPAGGAVVALNSSNSLVTVPATVTIPSGGTFATFTAKAGSLPSGTATSSITATDAATVSAVLTVTPNTVCTPQTCAQQGKNCGTISDGCGGTLTCGTCGGGQTCGGGGVANVCGGTTGTASLTVTVSGSGGNVTSSPSGLNVQSGHSGSAVFNTGTTLILSTQDGHGAVWAGACSSNGATTPTCSFTFNGPGSVTATNR